MANPIPYMYVAYMVLGITSCSANGTLIWIILRNRNFITTSNVIIVSLAASDFALGFIVSPMEMMHDLLPNFDIVGYGCLAHQVIMIFIPLVSIVHLLLVAVERFIMIVFPLHYHSIATTSRIALLLVAGWCFPLSLCILPFAGVHQNMVRVNGTSGTCSTLDMLPCRYLFSIIGIIGIICVIMAILYTLIMKIAYRHAQQMRRFTLPNPKSRFSKATELKALSVLVITVLYFIFSWTPFTINVVDECVTMKPTPYYTPAVFIAYFNSTVNPIIYGIGNRELRKSFLASCCRRKPTVAPDNTLFTTVSAVGKMAATSINDVTAC